MGCERSLERQEYRSGGQRYSCVWRKVLQARMTLISCLRLCLVKIWCKFCKHSDKKFRKSEFSNTYNQYQVKHFTCQKQRLIKRIAWIQKKKNWGSKKKKKKKKK